MPNTERNLIHKLKCQTPRMPIGGAMIDAAAAAVYIVEAQPKEGPMSEDKSSAVLSDEEILAIADQHLSRGVNERGGLMMHKVYFMETEKALVGKGVVRRDLPLLTGRMRPVPKEPSVPPANERSERILFANSKAERIAFTGKTYPKVNESSVASGLLGITPETAHEYVEVHYGEPDETTVVILHNGHVAMTRSVNVPSPSPL